MVVPHTFGLAFVARLMIAAIVRQSARILSSLIAFRNLLADARVALVFGALMLILAGKASMVARRLKRPLHLGVMTRPEVFRELNGFDESFATNFNDIDYCLRVRASGRRVVADHSVIPTRLAVGFERATVGTSASCCAVANSLGSATMCRQAASTWQ